MQTKLIKEIKFVGKATYESVRGIKFVQTFKRVSSDIEAQAHRIKYINLKYINVISIRHFLEAGIVIGCPHQVRASYVIQVG